MRQKRKRTSQGFVKQIVSYIICLSTPKSIVDAINEAANVDELDRAVVAAAGVGYADSNRVSNSC